MNMSTLRVATATAEEFVAFWSQLYSGYDEGDYAANIGQPLTPERIKLMFEWKNGGPLSGKKQLATQRYLLPEERLSADADNATLAAFLNRPGGTIWRIFWLHLQHPSRFPIYDQHVHRAMAFLLGSLKVEIPANNPAKVRTYIDEYLPFFRQFSAIPPRQIDRAMWTFGKFLTTEYSRVVGYSDLLPAQNAAESIPRSWLVEKIEGNSSYAAFAEELQSELQLGDEIWFYDEPAPRGVNAGELGVVLVRAGKIMRRVLIGIH